MDLESDTPTKYRIIWSSEALEDLWNIGTEIYALSGWDFSVNKWLSLIMDRGYGLNMFPRRNSMKISLGEKVYWHINVKHSYVIYYEIIDTEKTIIIRHIGNSGEGLVRIS